LKFPTFLKGALAALFLCLVFPAYGALTLKEDTATQVAIGPFLDGTDGVTPETALTVGDWLCDIVKHADSSMAKTDLTITASSGSNDAAHLGEGVYSLELTATDTNTAGRLFLMCTHATHTTFVPVFHEFMVMPAQEYDSLYGTDTLQTHPVEIANDLITAASIAADAVGASEAGFLTDSTGFQGADVAAILTDTGTTLDDLVDDLEAALLYTAAGSTTPSQAGITDIDSSGGTTDELILASGGVDSDNNLIGSTMKVTISGEDPMSCVIDDADDTTDTISCATAWETTPTAGGGDTYSVLLTVGEPVVTLSSGTQIDTNPNGQVRVAEGTSTGELNLSGGAIDVSQDGADAILSRACSGHTTDGTLGAICNDWEDTGRLDVIIDSTLADTGSDGVLVSSGTGSGQINVSSGIVQADMRQLDGSTQSAQDLQDFADAGYEPTSNAVAAVTTVINDVRINLFPDNTTEAGASGSPGS